MSVQQVGYWPCTWTCGVGGVSGQASPWAVGRPWALVVCVCGRYSPLEKFFLTLSMGSNPAF